MTNSEYFEKNKIPFAEAMEIFNKQKSKRGGTKSFDKFLASEHVETKFKVGDIVVLQLNEETRRAGWTHNVVFKVTGIEFRQLFQKGHYDYYVRLMTPDCAGNYDYLRYLGGEFTDRNCVFY